MDERLNTLPEDEGLATRRMVTKGVAAGGLAALFAAVGAGRVLADSGDDDDGVDDTTGDDGVEDDTTGDDGLDDTPGDDDQDNSGPGNGGQDNSGSGSSKGRHRRRRGRNGHH